MFDLLAKHLAVRYVYEEVAPPVLSEVFDRPAPREDDARLVEELAALPGEWVSDLQRAAILGDLRQMLQLLEQIRDRNRDLAEALAALSHEFEHERILMLIEEARTEP